MYKIIIIVLIFSLFLILIKKESFSKYTSHCDHKEKDNCCNYSDCRYIDDIFGCVECNDSKQGNICGTRTNSSC